MSSKITVGQAAEEYLSYRCARFAATTVKQEGYVLRRFAANVGLHRQVRYLQAKVVSDWFYGAQGVMCKHQTRDRTVRPAVQASTHNYYRSRLKALFLFWARRGYVREELLADVQPAKQLRKQRQQPTPQQLLDMLPSTDDLRDRAYLAALMNTGLRANEVLRLRVEDVDLDGDWLTVLIRKSQQEDRLPITLDLAPHLRRWLQRYREDLARALRPEDYLFPARTGNRFRKVTMANGTTGCINSPRSRVPDAR